jgi:hypothetical protein
MDAYLRAHDTAEPCHVPVGHTLRAMPTRDDPSAAGQAQTGRTPRIPSAAKEVLMKALYLIAGLCAAALSGCTVYPPTTTAYVSPPARVAYVSPTYVAPPYTAVVVP